MCAAYDVMPTDPKFLSLSDEQLHWMQHAKRMYLKEIFDNLGVMLGTTMEASQLYSGGNGKKSTVFVDKASVPLSVLVNPQAIQIFKGMIKKPTSQLDMINIAPDSFRELMKTSAQAMHNEAREALADIQNVSKQG